MTHLDSANFKPKQPAAEGFQQDLILGGRYRVLSLLGRGGMGVVYKVEQIFLGKELALKTISKAEQSEFTLRRFQTEARAVFSVNHPNIIAVHDFGVLDDGTPFMAMEVVTGQTLGELLETRLLSVDEAIPLFIQICFGLAHAHENGVVHRDIKPNNIMILKDHAWGTEGSVKILDFGIAKLTQHEGGELQALTRTGEIFGSPFYMSPEQCLGGKIDHRSDIYSLGCVLFEALAGTPPFVGENALSTMMAHQTADVPTMKEASLGKDFPLALERIVQRMLAKNPDERYQNLGLAAHDLADLKRGESSNISSVVSVPRPVKKVIPASDLVTLQKSSFLLILIATSATCAFFTAAALVLTHPPKPAAVVVAKDPTAETGLNYGNKIDNAFEKQPEKHKEELLDPIQQHAISFSAKLYPTDETLKVFDGYTGAQRLELRDSEVTDDGLKHLRDSKLLDLGLAGCKNIKSVDNIVGQKNLLNLDLRNTSITDSELPKLAKLSMLNVLQLDDCNITEKGVMALTNSPSLTIVVLPKEKFSPEFIDKLQRKLPQCAFQHYRETSNFIEFQKSTEKEDDHTRLKKFLATLIKATPRSRFVAQVLGAIAAGKIKQNQPDEAYKLLKQAEHISNETQDDLTLAGTLLAEADLLKRRGEQAKAAQLAMKSLHLDVATHMHDDPELLKRILAVSFVPDQDKDLITVIEMCKIGEQYVDDIPNSNSTYIPLFNERIGWFYVKAAKFPEAVPYLQRNLKYWQQFKDDNKPTPAGVNVNGTSPPSHFYARALVELGHAESDPQKRKVLYNESLDLLDSLKLPEDINLKEHYCDACDRMAAIFDAEGNSAEALSYLERALAAIKTMHHEDVSNRKSFFENRIADHRKSAAKK